jgi:hypothetical protein
MPTKCAKPHLSVVERHRVTSSAKIQKIHAWLTLRTPQRPKGEIFCILRSNIISRGRMALINALNFTFLWSSVTKILCSKSAKSPKIVTGLTLPAPKRPKLARFCIRRRGVISRGRRALQNALNNAILRSSVTEIRCCKFGEKLKILGYFWKFLSPSGQFQWKKWKILKIITELWNV